MTELSYSEIIGFMVSNKVHRDPFLTAQHVAQWMCVNCDRLSNEIEDGCGKTFPDLINEFRVKEAKELLCKKTFSGFSVDAIGRMSGFSKRQLFYSTFKEKTGYYPVDYKRIKSLQT